jgi:hypothetical protein
MGGLRGMVKAPIRSSMAWVVLGAVLVPCLYLPGLTINFDFVDDGNLVYPAPAMPLGQRLALLGEKILANQLHLGPIRPTLWAHWRVQADLLGGNPVAWRLLRLAWAMLASGAFLWLLRDLGIHPWAALATTAVAFWTPYRAEVWTSLTLSEGVAMPYALFALVCAGRAARSNQPGLWDVAGALCVLVALGCKITFLALVPAQLLLRIAPDGCSLQAGWRQHGRRACLLALTLLLPLAHYIYFCLSWRPGHYQTAPSWEQLYRMLSVLRGASGIGYLLPGLLLTVLALRGTGVSVLMPYRTAWLTGLALLVPGLVVYLPMDAVSGRYSIPAVWGLDLWLAALLSALASVNARRYSRLARTAVGCGLLALAVANVGKQERIAARIAMLWQALEYVEQQAPPDTCIGWLAGPNLNIEEGIHFAWHLNNRGRRDDLSLCLFDSDGTIQQRPELPLATRKPTLFLTGAAPANDARLRPVRTFEVVYWAGMRRYHCWLVSD